MKFAKSLYYSPKEHTFYLNKNNKIEKTSAINAPFTNVISLTNLKSFYNTTIDLPQDLPTSQIEDQIEFLTYNKLNLNIHKDYIIEFYHKAGNTYEVFVASKSYIENNLLINHKKFEHITVPPLVFGTLYSSKILKPEGLDCFIYFGEEESFMTLYKNGQYELYDSINFSLKGIHSTNFADIEYEEFCTMLVEDKINLDYFGYTILDDLKTSLKDLKLTLEIDSFANIFVDADCKLGRSIYKLATKEFDQEVKHLGFSSKFLGVDTLTALTLKYQQTPPKKRINFVSHKQSDSFAFKFGLSLIASLILSLSYPLYQLYKTQLITKEIKTKNIEITTIKQNLDKYISTITEKQKQLDTLKELLKTKSETFQKSIASLKELEKIASKQQNSQLLLNLTKGLNSASVNLKNIQITAQKQHSIVSLNIYTNEHKNIAKFLHEISRDNLNIVISSMKKNKDRYEAKIEVVV